MGGLKHWRLDYVWYGSSDTRMLSRIESGNHYLTLVGTAERTWIPSVVKERSISVGWVMYILRAIGNVLCESNRVGKFKTMFFKENL